MSLKWFMRLSGNRYPLSGRMNLKHAGFGL
ncbi:hypothetical protein FB001_111187, partial [Ensifer sp. SEMIA 135]